MEATDPNAHEHSHMRACLDELRSYCGADYAGTFEIERIPWGSDPGYARDGTYYGTGIPVYTVIYTEVRRDSHGTYEATATRTVRAVDRPSLRAALARRFPGAKVSR